MAKKTPAPEATTTLKAVETPAPVKATKAKKTAKSKKTTPPKDVPLLEQVDNVVDSLIENVTESKMKTWQKVLIGTGLGLVVIVTSLLIHAA